MRRREAKAAGDAAYIKWLEDRLSFLRLLVCALLAFSVLSAATLGVVLSEQEKPPVTRSAEVYSYFTPKPTMRHGGNPLEKYAPTNQEKTVYVSKSGLIHTRPNCSGMKYYTEMTLSEALKHGYARCSKCGYD